MIEVSGKRRPIRETTAPFQYNDPEGGELKTENITVRYYLNSPADSQERRAKFAKLAEENPEAMVYLSDELEGLIADLPDIKFVDVKEPRKNGYVTAQALATIANHNLKAINKAIEEDLNPKD